MVSATMLAWCQFLELCTRDNIQLHLVIAEKVRCLGNINERSITSSTIYTIPTILVVVVVVVAAAAVIVEVAVYVSR